jgi:fatty-acyl-CoA synthase
MKPAYFHQGSIKPLLGVTLDAYFKTVVEQHGKREAVVSIPQDRRLSYIQLDQEVELLARGLVGLGVKAGDRVAIWSPNNVEWILVQLAAARIGAILVNINPAILKGEVSYNLKAAGVSVLFLPPSFRKANYAEMILEVQPDLRHCVVFDPEQPMATRPPDPYFTPWQDVIAAGANLTAEQMEVRAAAVDPDATANIQFTSGTTGEPKPVMLTHHNLLNNAVFGADALGFTPEDRLCVVVPFFHCFGMVMASLACLTHGSALVIPATRFDPELTLEAVQKEGCTALHGVPTMFIKELELPGIEDYDLSTLRTGIMAGAPCPPELMKRVIEDLGCRGILIGYGQTEASPLTHLTRAEDSIRLRTETVGTSLPHQEAKIVDPETGDLLRLGEQGEVCFRGYHIMRGYYCMERATRQAVDEAGWLHSGDLGVMEEGGYVRITGRLKDMIIRGGENLYPAEIESIYYEHPKVAEIAVFGMPDEEMGETVGAWVKLHDGMQASQEELQEWAQGRMARYKVPDYIRFVDEFPMTHSGKIQKFRIVQEMADSQPA